MIRKYLICGKHVYLQSKKLESYEEQGTVIELVMPVDQFWEIEKRLKQADYMLASGETGAEVATVYRKIFSMCAPFAVGEKERIWLSGKAKD